MFHSASVDDVLVQVVILPSHGDLQNAMELLDDPEPILASMIQGTSAYE